jgi:hypothetical protein
MIAGPCLAASTACYNKKASDWDGGGSIAKTLILYLDKLFKSFTYKSLYIEFSLANSYSN